jgi:hypothetical protein
MSGSKRTTIDRHRKPLIDDTTLSLFCELESMPRRGGYHAWRSNDEIRRLDRELHERLGLGGEWFCSVCSVLDRRAEHHNPGSLQDADFRRVRAVRLALLEEVVRRGYTIAGKPSRTSREPPST